MENTDLKTKELQAENPETKDEQIEVSTDNLPNESLNTEDEVKDLNDDLLSESETGKIMAEINASKAVEKNSKKKKKKSKGKKGKGYKQKHLYSAIIISVTVGILCGGVGLVGGYFLHTMTKPEVTYTADVGDLRGLEARAKDSTDLLKTFENDPYNLVNLAMIKFAKKQTSLILSKNVAANFSGDQNVNSATINTKDRTWNENISKTDEGAIVEIKTAFRFYDNHDEVVTAYEYKDPKDWVPGVEPTKNYTYDEYMDAYGKLNQGLYVIDDDKKFVTSDYTVEEGELISGVSIFQITKKSVKNTTMNHLDNGQIEINLELYSNRACFYSSKQIKTNGGLPKNPSFQELVQASFILDENFELVSSTSTEFYKVTMGVEVDVVTTAKIRYFSSDTDELIVNGTIVEIPEIHEAFPLKINDEGEFVS